MLNEGKPPQNGIKINYSCLPETGKEMVLLSYFVFQSIGLVASGLKQTLHTVLSDSLKISFCLSSKAWICSMLLTNPFFSLETSSMAFAANCALAIPTVLLYPLLPGGCRADCSVTSRAGASCLSCFCTGFNLITVQLSEQRNHIAFHFAAHPQNIANILFAVLR